MEIWNAIFLFQGKNVLLFKKKKKYKQPYLGIVEGNRFNHPALLTEKRSRMKIMLFGPNTDLPVDVINNILQQTINFYKRGIIKTSEKG